MERRKKKKDSNFLTGLLTGAGVAALAYGGFKLAEALFKDNDDPKPQRETASNVDKIQTDFTDVQNPLHEDDDTYVECEEDIFLCPISGEFMNDPYVLSNCGHSFEKRNIYQWLQRKQICPICNRKTSIENLIPNFHLRSVLQKKKEQLKAKNY